MKIVSYITALFSLLCLAFIAIATALGWERIFYCTQWVGTTFAYPAGVLFVIVLFGMAIARARTITRASISIIVALLIAVLIWIGFTFYDRTNDGALVAMICEWLNMSSIIVEEQDLNNNAVLYGILLPVSLLPSVFVISSLLRKRGF